MQARSRVGYIAGLLSAQALLSPSFAASDDANKDRLDQASTPDKTPADVKGEQPQKSSKGVPENPESATRVHSLREMIEQGAIDGNLRFYDFTSHNAFFVKDQDQNTGSFGGKLGFTTASLKGFSVRLAFYAQRGIDHTEDTAATSAYALAPDITALGEAYLQWQSDNIVVRVGNQTLDVPFASSLDIRIVRPTFQGVSMRAGDDDSFLTAMRIFRYKSYISNDFDKTTTFNAGYAPFGVNTTETTNGFWGVGGGHRIDAGPASIKGQAWFFNYMDYANMFYADGQISSSSGSVKPFFGLQFIRQIDAGRALLGDIDHHTYGAQLGFKHSSLTGTLNFDYIPHRNGTFLNGSLAAPYEHNVASGPYFAQPFLTSTQDLGSGSAYSADINGAAFADVFLGARYSYMDLVPQAGARSIGQSEYLVYGIYNFKDALDGLSLANFFAYQTQDVHGYDFWQNRVQLQYKF